jgi:hypothetical protein
MVVKISADGKKWQEILRIETYPFDERKALQVKIEKDTFDA